MITADLRAHLHAAMNIVVFTGAGISAESGIPTFRDRFEGMWTLYEPQDVASLDAFRRHPQTVWDWHVDLAAKIRQTAPNAGHAAVARLASLVPNLTVITQNIDNLHQAAGSSTVLELHGNIFRLKAFVDADELFAGDRSPIICRVCDGYAVADECDPYATKEDLAAIGLRAGPIPRCPACGALLRPDVVWFGEPLRINVLESAMRAADACDALICIGSSLEVQPAASLPIRAMWGGAKIIEINPRPTTLSLHADAFLQGKADEVLPQLIDEVWGSGA